MKNLKNLTLTFTFILVIFLLPNLVSAHNGSRDELGGHYRRADCTYQLHEPTQIAKSAKNMNELIGLINKYNSNSDCAASLNESKVNLEGFTFPKAGTTSVNSDQAATNAPTTAPTTGKLQLGENYDAKLIDCTDGDTAVFKINGKDYKTRFLYIDAPESTTSIELFGSEAAEFTCSFLKQGKITLETDGRNLFDKYDRLLAWVWVGDKLHQEEITKAGLVEDFYDYGTYNYENRMWAAMDYAKSNHMGMYGSTKQGSNKKKHDQPESETMKNQEQSGNEAKETGEKADEKGSAGKSGSTSEGSESENKGLTGWGFLAVLLGVVLLFLIKLFKKRR